MGQLTLFIATKLAIYLYCFILSEEKRMYLDVNLAIFKLNNWQAHRNTKFIPFIVGT